MQTLPTALNQAATTGMLTGPGFGLCALDRHSSGTDNSKFYLGVFVAAELCVLPDSRFYLPALNPADWRRGWCLVRPVRCCCSLPAFFIQTLERTFIARCPVVHLLYIFAPCFSWNLLVSPFTPSPLHSAVMHMHPRGCSCDRWDQGNEGWPVDRESRQGNFLLPRL